MEVRVPKPEGGLGITDVLHRCFREEPPDLTIACIVEAPLIAPDLTYGKAVLDQGQLVAGPHTSDRVIAPTLSYTGKDIEDLEALDALLAESLLVQYTSTP